MSERHLRFRPDVEGLRAIAILLVVLFHAGWSRVAGGYLGVDVFFVLSGYLISGLLLDEAAATGRVSLTHFWARRARRLLPAAATITLVVLIADAVLLSPFDQHTFAETAQAFSVYGSNLLFAVRSLEYFGGAAARDPLLHTWSLSVEEQFYLFFAPAVLGLAWWARRRGPEALRRGFGVAAAVVSVASLAGCLWLAQHYPIIAFYSLPARAWEFGLGALAVLATREGGWLTERLGALGREVLAALGILAILAAALLLRDGAAQPLGLLNVVPTLGTAALLLAAAPTDGVRPTLVARILGTAPLRLLGRLSYSWYLWHWPALVYLRELVSRPSLRLSIAVAVLSLAPAAVTYLLIESPVRFSPRLKRRAPQVVVAAVLLALFTAATGAAAIARANGVLATPRYAPIAEAGNLSRALDDGCLAEPTAETSPPCRYGPGRNDTTVVLFGDSHAAQWFPALDSIASLRGWTLRMLTKSACPLPDVVVVNASLGRRYVECERWRQHTIAQIVALRPALIVTASVRSYNILVDGRKLRTDASAPALAAWREGMTRSLAALVPSGARLLVLQDTPRMPFDVPRCLVKNLDQPSRCQVTPQRALDPKVAAAEREASAAVPGVAYVDMNPTICSATSCPSVSDGIVRYRDTNHLSRRYAASFAPALSEAFTESLAGSLGRSLGRSLAGLPGR